MRSFLTSVNVLVAGLVWLLVPTLAVLAAPANTDNKAAAESPAEKARRALEQTLSVEYNEASLQFVLDDLSEKTKIRFVADRGNLGILPDNSAISLKLQDAKAATVLRMALAQMNLSYLVLDGNILVTTEDAAIDRQLRQRVSLDLEEVPLEKALKTLAKNTRANLVLDPRTAKEVKAAPLTMLLEDVPLETAVRLMAEMAGLKSARIGNVLYVTSEARADKLRKEEEEKNRPPQPVPVEQRFAPPPPFAPAPAAPAAPAPNAAPAQAN
jgi:hypothetical protein